MSEREYQEQAKENKSSIGMFLSGDSTSCDRCGTSLPDLHRSCGVRECEGVETFCMACPDTRCSVCERPFDVFDYSKDEDGRLHPYAAKAWHFCDAHLGAALEKAEEGSRAAEGGSYCVAL